MEDRSGRLDLAGLGCEVVINPLDAQTEERDLCFDVIGRPRGFITQQHVHTGQIERFEVLAGSMAVKLGGRTHALGPGDRFEVPAGATHRQISTGSGPGHVRVTVSPAGRTAVFLHRLAQMSRDGQLNRLGMPRPVPGARLIREFADTGHAAFPPLGVQRAMAAAVLGCEGPSRAASSALRGGVRRLWREYEFVDEWHVAAPPPAVYDVLLDGCSYPRWWRPDYISVQSSGPTEVGSVASQHFKGRLPYHLHTRSTIVRLEPGRLIEAEVDGDLRGRGIWRLEPTPAGTKVRFDWTVDADRPLLRILTPLLRGVLRANHNWSIARAKDGLEPYVLARSRYAADDAAGAGEEIASLRP